jgi:hypothetical protein
MLRPGQYALSELGRLALSGQLASSHPRVQYILPRSLGSRYCSLISWPTSRSNSDLGTLAASKWASPEDPFVSKFESMSKTPILTSFIASLSTGNPFRVSIHSWSQPSPSSLLKARKTKDEPTAFQVRVYVDGALHGLDHIFSLCGEFMLIISQYACVW